MYNEEQSKKETGSLHGWEIKHKENKRIFVLAAPTDDDKLAWCDILHKTTGVAQARGIQTANKTKSKIAESTRSRLKSLGAFTRPAIARDSVNGETSVNENAAEATETTTTETTTTGTTTTGTTTGTTTTGTTAVAETKSAWGGVKPQEKPRPAWSMRAPSKSKGDNDLSDSKTEAIDTASSESELEPITPTIPSTTLAEQSEPEVLQNAEVATTTSPTTTITATAPSPLVTTKTASHWATKTPTQAKEEESDVPATPATGKEPVGLLDSLSEPAEEVPQTTEPGLLKKKSQWSSRKPNKQKPNEVSKRASSAPHT